MALPVLRIETIRQQALELLRAAVVAANAVGAPESALKALYIPEHRFEKLKPERAPFLHVAAKSDGGEGNSHLIPQIDLVGTLHFNLFHAGTRGDAPDLDKQAAEMAEAVCLTLLEDNAFITLFGWVSGLRIAIDDGIAKGDQGSDHDCVLVQIELEMSGDQQLFEPRAGVPLTTINTRTPLGEEEQSIPGQSLVIRQEILIPQDEEEAP